MHTSCELQLPHTARRAHNRNGAAFLLSRTTGSLKLRVFSKRAKQRHAPGICSQLYGDQQHPESQACASVLWLTFSCVLWHCLIPLYSNSLRFLAPCKCLQRTISLMTNHESPFVLNLPSVSFISRLWDLVGDRDPVWEHSLLTFSMPFVHLQTCLYPLLSHLLHGCWVQVYLIITCAEALPYLSFSLLFL